MALRLIRDLLGERPLLPPLPAKTPADVAPGSRRQDHTTSPYVAGPARQRAAASIASHRTVRDDREPPLLPGGTDGLWHTSSLLKRRIFCSRGVDRHAVYSAYQNYHGWGPNPPMFTFGQTAARGFDLVSLLADQLIVYGRARRITPPGFRRSGEPNPK